MFCVYWRFCVVYIDIVSIKSITAPDPVSIKSITARYCDGCGSKLINVESGGQQGSVLGPSLFFLYTSGRFSILQRKLIGYADDFTLIAVVPSSGIRVVVAKSLNHALVKVCEWCGLWGMKLNASKTKTMIVSRSCTMHPQLPALTIGRTVLKESDDLVVLGVTFDSKMTIEKHHCSVSRVAS